MVRSLAIFIFLSIVFSCSDLDMTRQSTACEDIPSTGYDKAAQVQAILDRYTTEGVTGVGIAVITPTQEWTSASGFAKIEDQTEMVPCHLQYSQSVAKTYTAVL